MRRLVTTLFAALSLLLPAASLAASERVASFDSNIHVSKQNVLDITETIVYDFGDAAQHGIYRDVPIDYRDSEGKYYYINFKLLGITQDGSSAKVDKSESSGNQRLKIGDPDRTITGQHTYVIHYQLTPVVNQKDGKDHLALDITGNGWDVPIDKASAKIEFDGSPSISGATCFFGSAGSTDTSGCQISGNPTAGKSLESDSGGLIPPITLATIRPLAANEGITFEAFLPSGYVDHYLVAGQKRPVNWADFWPLLVGGPITLLVLYIFVIRQWRERRRKKSQTIIAEYDPPDKLTPGDIGYLHDDTANTVEVTATLIDLAVRGYIKIIQTQPKSFMRKAKYDIERVASYANALQYEQNLLNALFGTASRVSIDSLNKTEMAKAVESMRSTIKSRLTGAGYYGQFSAQKGLMAKMVESGNISDTGAKEWAKVEGFKLYLSVVEKDRLKFTDAPEKTPERFSKLLPYAVALGVEKEWAKQFEGIDVAPTTGWYEGSPGMHFTAFALADSLSSGFAASVSNNFVAPSGGGGSSGGGFGGGGGGSW